MPHYIKRPAVFMLAQPSKGAEVVSEALFSEQVELIEEEDGWHKIATSIDQYQGWVEADALCACASPFAAADGMVDRLAAHLYDRPEIIYGPSLTLPYESRLQILDKMDERWIRVQLPTGKKQYVQRRDLQLTPRLLNPAEICALSQRFLGLPYTWGGRSSFGYDCSGFVQMLYRQMGVFLPRDAKDQAVSTLLRPIALQQLQPGDLLFFGQNQGKIRHVALYLGAQQFIHSSVVSEPGPFIRINSLQDPMWNGSGYYPHLTAFTRR